MSFSLIIPIISVREFRFDGQSARSQAIAMLDHER
jgi:hypothetical protein